MATNTPPQIKDNNSQLEKRRAFEVSIPASAPRAGNAFLGRLGVLGLKLFGWRVHGSFVDQPKLIAVVAPHSSNWDWIIGVCGLWALRLKFSYLIKKQAFVWPISILIRRTGGIGIDRSNPGGIVNQVVSEFEKADKLYYAITPEGTRSSVKSWKNGFLRIAYEAGVPIIPVSIDYPTKEFYIAEPFDLTGDIDRDLEHIRDYFKKYTGRA